MKVFGGNLWGALMIDLTSFNQFNQAPGASAPGLRQSMKLCEK